MARVWVQRLSDPFYTAAGYLKWKDVQISGPQDGKSFIASIQFNWWKGWTKVRQDSYHPLSCSLLKYRKRILIRAPHTIDNINLSIPHRLLALTFYRNLLCDDSPDTGVLTLLQGSAIHIGIKTDAQEMPVFLATGKRGLILTDRPMQSRSFVICTLSQKSSRKVRNYPRQHLSRYFLLRMEETSRE